MSKRWAVAVAVAVLGACASNNQGLQDKVASLSQQVASLQSQLDELRRRPTQHDDTQALISKITELSTKVDALIARGGAPRPRRPEPDKAKVYAVPVDGYPSQGPADAKVTMVVARDYACPYCEKARATLVALRQKYGADLRLVYRNLVVHPATASVAAFASCAAARQGKFEPFDELLWERGFKNRAFDKYGSSAACWTAPAGCAIVDGFAIELKLKMDQFQRDLAGCEAEVKADTAALTALGAGATPAFYINGRYMAGAMPVEQFQSLIDEELGNANTRIQAGTRKAAYYKTWVLDKGLTKLEAPIAN